MADQAIDFDKAYAFLEKAQTSRDKVLACLYCFQLIGKKMGMDTFEPGDIANFIGLPADLVTAELEALRAEGMVARTE